jgi:hypothetical protein
MSDRTTGTCPAPTPVPDKCRIDYGCGILDGMGSAPVHIVAAVEQPGRGVRTSCISAGAGHTMALPERYGHVDDAPAQCRAALAVIGQKWRTKHTLKAS